MDSMALKDQVKQSISLLDVVTAHLPLTRHGNNYMGLCPFHRDKTPSFSVSPEKNLFYCFGCKAKGDVIQFIQMIEKVSFKEALNVLAEKEGLGHDLSSNGQDEQTRIKNKALLDAVKHYHRLLFSPEGKEALEYLKQRGLDEHTLQTYRVGYIPSETTTEDFLSSKSYTLDQVKATGLLIRAGEKHRDRFYHRIIFPNLLRGFVVHITARALDNTHPKYLHLPGAIHHLYNEELLRLSSPRYPLPSVVLTEGILDCLTLLQMGFPAVSLYGVSSYKSSWTEKFAHCEKVCLFFDADDPGKKAAVQVAELLNVKARIVTLPDFQGKDVNEFYASGATTEDAQNLLDRAQTLIEHHITNIPPDTPKAKLLEFLKPILHNLAQMDEIEAQNVILHILKPHFRLTHQEVKPYLKLLKHQRKQIQNEKAEAEREKQEQVIQPVDLLTEEEKQEALRFLKDPNLLQIFLHDIETLGCTGEEDNKLLVGLALTSRKLEDPINLIIKGESSAGKNYLVKSVAELFPEEDVELRTRLTSHALFYKDRHALKHKALIVFERNGSEESDYSIRSLQSEKKLIIEVPVKDPDSGKWKAETYEVEGPVCFIETTTRPHIHPENETRCFDIFIDESTEQTRRIFSVQDTRYLPQAELSPDIRAGILKKHKNAQRLLETHPVMIPYIKHIQFPLQPLRVRRDRGRFLSMIEASAFWHQEQREKRKINGTDYILANLHDYTLAYRLASRVLSQTMKEVTPKAEALIQACANLNGAPITRQDLLQALRWNTRTLMKYLHEAVSCGCLEIIDGGQGRPYQYRLVKTIQTVSCPLLPPEELNHVLESE